MKAAITDSSAQMDPSTWLDDHGDVLFRYAMARVRRSEIAEDLVQETLLAAIQGVGGFSGGSGVRAWLLGIMRHKVIDHIRRQVRDRRVVAAGEENLDGDQNFDESGAWAVDVADWGSPEKMLQQTQFWTVFERCLEELPENFRATFVLREFDGVGSDALASMLNTTKNNLWVMLSRARERLRNCLQVHWIEQS